MSDVKRADFFNVLKGLGFLPYKPYGQTWRTAYVGSNGNSVMMIMIRKNGVDIKMQRGSTLSDLEFENDLLIHRNADLYRNHYRKAGINLHDHIFNLATHFVKGTLKPSMLAMVGISWRDDKEYLEELKRRKAGSRSNDGMTFQEMREAFGSGDPNESVYLGDGIYI